MNKRTIGWIVFGGAMATSLLLYIVTRSSVAVSESLYAAHPVWAAAVSGVGGNPYLLSAVCGALAVAIGAWFICGICGWRLGIAAALVLMFLPAVWDGVIRGGLAAPKLALLAVGVWLGFWLVLLIVKRIWGDGFIAAFVERLAKYASRIHRLGRIGMVVLYSAVIVFVFWSLTYHQYGVGEVEREFAEGVLRVVDGRWLVENGVATDSIRAAAADRGVELVELRRDRAYWHQLAERVKTAWPDDMEMQRAAEKGPVDFADFAMLKYPDRVFALARGLPDWEGRWKAMRRFLKSGDPFVPSMRRSFAFEANAIGNRLQDEEKPHEAWETYYRVFAEVEPDNFSAIVNMNEMLEDGYKAPRSESLKVKRAMELFLKDRQRTAHIMEIVAESGPIRASRAKVEKMREELMKRLADRKLSHEVLPVPPEIRTLIDWSNEMVHAANNRDWVTASRIARTILANPPWRNYIPANAILGSVVGHEGNLAASEAYFRKAVATTNAIPAIVMNDFAETLRLEGKLDEAEIWARRAVSATKPDYWVARLTLAETLIDAKRNYEEAGRLLDQVSGSVSAEAREFVEPISRRLRQCLKP